jgi:thioredoxin-related protein
LGILTHCEQSHKLLADAPPMIGVSHRGSIPVISRNNLNLTPHEVIPAMNSFGRSLVLATLILFPASSLSTYAAEHKAPAGAFQHATVEEAWQAAVVNKRPLLVMFTSDNCTFCRKMLAETYSHQGIQQMLRGRTETVMAHSNDYAALIQKLGIRGYPSTLLISPQGEVLDFMEGYVAPKEFAQRVAPLLEQPAERLGMTDKVQFAN